MKRKGCLKFFVLMLTFSLIFSVVSVVSFATEEKAYISIGESVLYNGLMPDADTFIPVYYKNDGTNGSENDYNAKLEYGNTGFILTINGLEIINAFGEHSIFASTDLNIVVLTDSKIVHTVNVNTKNRYAIYIDGKLDVSGDGDFGVYLRGDCDFSALEGYAARAHEISGTNKINARDGRSEQEKQFDSIKDEFKKELSKTNYDLAIAKLNLANTAEKLGFEAQKAKNIAIAAVVIGSVSLVANIAIAVVLIVNRQKVEPDFDEDDE